MSSFLQVKKINKRFGGLQAVIDLEFEMERGQILGLIGPNGAGKTTAFNMIAGFFPPDDGKVMFKGEDITGLKPWQVNRKGIARTFQLSKPFDDLSVLENTMVGAFARDKNRKAVRRKSEEILELVGMADQKEVVAQNLTATDRKKLELARALATDPELLLMDEVVAGATPKEASEMMDLILLIRDKGVSILIVEHVMKVIMGLSDRVVVLNYGKKLTDCAPQEAVCNLEVLKAYLGEKYVNTANS
jgi:branched-chain amino acid transport system ATP-binding protein